MWFSTRKIASRNPCISRAWRPWPQQRHHQQRHYQRLAPLGKRPQSRIPWGNPGHRCRHCCHLGIPWGCRCYHRCCHLGIPWAGRRWGPYPSHHHQKSCYQGNHCHHLGACPQLPEKRRCHHYQSQFPRPERWTRDPHGPCCVSYYPYPAEPSDVPAAAKRRHRVG